MTTATEAAARTAAHELIITRSFAAPRALVFKAWTEPEHIVRWCGPHGFTMTHCELDMRPGGRYRCAMHSAEYGELWWQGVCREYEPPERLCFTFAWLDENGIPGQETLISIVLVERDGKTEMTFRQAPFETGEDRDGHSGGWTEAFEKLEQFLRTPST